MHDEVTQWTITSWQVTTGDPNEPNFPPDGFDIGGTLVAVPANDGLNLFWPNQAQLPCCVRYPVTDGAMVCFATIDGMINVPCETAELSYDPVAHTLTCTLTAKHPGSTDNTGTFTAQATTDGRPTEGGSYRAPRS